jgi:Anti-sigma-K factor rskA, C-terminal
MESFETAPVIRFYGSEAGDDPVIEDVEPRAAEERPELRLVPPRPARAPGLIAMLATLVGILALGLATWAFVSVVRTVDEDTPTVAPPQPQKPKPARAAGPARVKPNRALALLALPTTERYRVAGAVGRITLAVVPGERGFLALNGLWRAPRGRVYVAWLVPPSGRTIRPAATFRGGTGLVALRGRVSEGAAVAVTVERPGTGSPTRTPRLVAVRRP